MSLERELRKAAAEFAREVRLANAQRLQRAKAFLGQDLAPLAPFTKAVKGHAKIGFDTGKMLQSMRARRSPFDRFEFRGPNKIPRLFIAPANDPREWSKLLLFIRGSRKKVTEKMQTKLRRMGIKAGVFRPHMAYLPAHSGPFAVGKTIVQPPRPVIGIGERAAHRFIDRATAALLRAKGFK